MSTKQRRRSAIAALFAAALALLFALPSFASADPAGSITEFNLPAGSLARQIAAGPDGNLWFTMQIGATRELGSMTPSGTFTPYKSGLNSPTVPNAIALGSDGNLWFTDSAISIGGTSAIGRITTAGTITEFSAGLNAEATPADITSGPGGNLWFTDRGPTKAIGEINPTTQEVTEFEGATGEGKLTEGSSTVENLTTTSAAEFTVGSSIFGAGIPEGTTITSVGEESLTMSAAATESEEEVPLNGGLQAKSEPFGIAAGPDGNVWFTDARTEGTPMIGRITPAGVITEFGESAGLNPGSIPGSSQQVAAPWGIAPGSDGNVWFTDSGTTKAIGRITPSGSITEYSAGLNAEARPRDLALGPEGDLWFPDEGTTRAVGRIDPVTQKITEYSVGLNAGTRPFSITAGPEGEGTMWFFDFGTTRALGKIGTEGGPTGPTNLRTLTVTKSGNGPGGTGAVSSKPKGIKCGTTCSSAVASMYKETPVVLTEKPGTTSTFVEWTGACSGSAPTCTVPMSEDEEVGAVFAGTSKELNPAEALTVSKGESSGKGTVKGPGLGCEAECTSTVVLFQGPITEPKAKPGKIVVLKQAPAFGSAFSGWSGCESEPEGNCQVTMETAKEVTAEYTALPNKALTVNKEYAKGNGSVSSKPKGIKCGTTCTQAVAQMPEGASVELTAKPSTGTFVKWEGGDCNGSTNPVCTVTMNTDETTKAVFSDPGKAFSPAETLTLNKAGSGFGTVKAAGLGCEVLCSSTSVIYQGPITEPKAKPGKVVVLKATSAPGSKAVEWSGCDSETEAGECVVAMETAKEVTATFDELE